MNYNKKEVDSGATDKPIYTTNFKKKSILIVSLGDIHIVMNWTA